MLFRYPTLFQMWLPAGTSRLKASIVGLGSRAQALLVQLRQSRFGGPILLALAYYVSAQAAFYIGTLSDRIFALFWLPNVILFCALIVVPYRSWGYYVAAALPAHVLAELSVGMHFLQLVVAFVTNCMVALLNAFLTRRILGSLPWFDEFRKAAAYVAITGAVAPALSAFGGALVPILGGGSPSRYWMFFAYWYAANALPNLTIGPVFLTWIMEPPRSGKRSAFAVDWEVILVVLSLVAVCLLAFRLSPVMVAHGFLPALLYSPLPIILWSAVRYGAKGASGAILIVTLVSMLLVFNGSSVFGGADPEKTVLALQLFLTGLAAPVLLLSAAVEGFRRARLQIRELAGSLLRAQDEERRRIARELHDSTGQNLIAAALLTERLREGLPTSHEPIAKRLDALLQGSIQELRTLSYVLHPPLLDESGLETALRHYVAGYTQRSGIAVDLHVGRGVGRLPPDMELALFRVVQEALVNVSRHSGSLTAHVRLTREATPDGERVVLSIEDFGKGMPGSEPYAPLVGAKPVDMAVARVGLLGIQERLRQIGGDLQIDSTIGRTMLRASIPVDGDSAVTPA